MFAPQCPPATVSSRGFPSLPLRPTSDNPHVAKASADFMANVQGGILAGRGRGGRVALVFFRFSDPANTAANAAAVRATASKVTSSLEQYHRVGAGKKNEVFRSVMLTASGLEACGLKPNTPDGYFPEKEGRSPEFPLMRGERALFGDLPPGEPDPWEQSYLSRIDGAWLLGHATPQGLSGAVSGIRGWCRGHGLSVVLTERGHVPEDGKELFGFRDGISMQRFFTTVAGALPTELGEVFLPRGRAFGSTFMVFRKLEQNVRAFRHFIQEKGIVQAEALVGRKMDAKGTSLAPGNPPSRNSFDYTDDRNGAACPFHAHVRRANPRCVTDSSQFRRLHLVRRGVVYGPRRLIASKRGAEKGVGLLFMAYTSAIETFRDMQGSWFPNPNFPVPAARQTMSSDGLIFGPPEGSCPGVRRWIVPRGGAYFFVPSLPWLEHVQPDVVAP